MCDVASFLKKGGGDGKPSSNFCRHIPSAKRASPIRKRSVRPVAVATASFTMKALLKLWYVMLSALLLLSTRLVIYVSQLTFLAVRLYDPSHSTWI